MRPAISTPAAIGLALVVVLCTATSALAASAVDQYQEAIPTAGGQKPTGDATTGAGAVQRGTATIAPGTRAKLDKTKNGAATARAAEITAPSQSNRGSGSSGDEGLGLILPLILAATLTGAVMIVLARRRHGQASG